jgi:hypothetical protein
MTVDLRSFAVFTTALLSFSLTSASNIDSPVNKYLPSYEQQAGTPYSASVSTSKDFSSYFYKQEVQCEHTSCYSAYHDAYTTRLTSLLDIKMQSYLYAHSYVSIVQFAFANSSLIRNYPYAQSTSLASPTTCSVTDPTLQMCRNIYANSKCSHSDDDGEYSYYPYDPRCRNWFQVGFAATDPEGVIVQTPKRSSAGQFIVTTIAPIYSAFTQSDTSVNLVPQSEAIEAVVNFNILMSRLSESLNALPILTHGYSYMVNSLNTSVVILHPAAAIGCISIECTEGAPYLSC